MPPAGHRLSAVEVLTANPLMSMVVKPTFAANLLATAAPSLQIAVEPTYVLVVTAHAVFLEKQTAQDEGLSLSRARFFDRY